MSEADAGGSVGKGVEQTPELIDQERREALTRFAKYTAPAVLAVLISVNGKAAVAVSLPISDIRLKRDIAPVGGVADGIGLYRYRYLWSDTIHVGVMAQEVAAVMPEAVRRGTDGYLRVDYARLGLQAQTWDEWVAAQ
jgi:endosialidase-like protein